MKNEYKKFDSIPGMYSHLYVEGLENDCGTISVIEHGLEESKIKDSIMFTSDQIEGLIKNLQILQLQVK